MIDSPALVEANDSTSPPGADSPRARRHTPAQTGHARSDPDGLQREAANALAQHCPSQHSGNRP